MSTAEEMAAAIRLAQLVAEDAEIRRLQRIRQSVEELLLDIEDRIAARALAIKEGLK